jgi:hypothetical protein
VVLDMGKLSKLLLNKLITTGIPPPIASEQDLQLIACSIDIFKL